MKSNLWNVIGCNWMGHFPTPEGLLLIAEELDTKVDMLTFEKVIQRFVEDYLEEDYNKDISSK